MNIFKKIFRKKSEEEKKALALLKVKNGQKITVDGYCTFLHPEIDAEGFLRYVKKIVLDIPIERNTEASHDFWDIFYWKYRDGFEPFNFKDYWVMYIDPIPAISKLDDLYSLKVSFMNFCKKEEMPIRNGELYTWKKEWDFFWEHFCNKYHPGYIRVKSPYEILKVRENCPVDIVEKEYTKLKANPTGESNNLEAMTKAFEEIKGLN